MMLLTALANVSALICASDLTGFGGGGAGCGFACTCTDGPDEDAEPDITDTGFAEPDPGPDITPVGVAVGSGALYGAGVNDGCIGIFRTDTGPVPGPDILPPYLDILGKWLRELILVVSISISASSPQ